MEAAERILVPHALNLDLFLVEELSTLVILPALAQELQSLSRLCAMGWQDKVLGWDWVWHS